MRPSIPVSASVDLAPARGAPAAGYLPRLSFMRILRRPSGVAGILFMSMTVATALFAPVLATDDPFALTGPPLASPSSMHLMGTDALGRDVFSGVVHGARTSLSIAVAVGSIALVAGLCVGMTAGYRGGIVDDVLMRITELFQVLPRFFLVAVAIALFGPGLDRVIITLGITSWPVLARVVRSEVVAMRHLEFVLAAEALGASPGRILRRVLLPHVMPGVLVLLGLLLGQVLLVEASLGFLGLGDPNTITWGMLAGQAQAFLRVAWWMSLFPGLAITVSVLGFNLLADALSETAESRVSSGH